MKGIVVVADSVVAHQDGTVSMVRGGLAAGLPVSIISMDDYFDAEEECRRKANAALAALINVSRLREL